MVVFVSLMGCDEFFNRSQNPRQRYQRCLENAAHRQAGRNTSHPLSAQAAIRLCREASGFHFKKVVSLGELLYWHCVADAVDPFLSRGSGTPEHADGVIRICASKLEGDDQPLQHRNRFQECARKLAPVYAGNPSPAPDQVDSLLRLCTAVAILEPGGSEARTVSPEEADLLVEMGFPSITWDELVERRSSSAPTSSKGNER